MNSCSQSLLQPSVPTRRCSLVPSGEIDITHRISTTLPLEIWDKIFNYLGFQELKLFTEHKVKVLKEPLNGNEDNHRLMIGKIFICYKETFLDVVESVYSVALCCKEFYGLTQRERKLLIEAARWARVDRQFFISEQILARNKKDEGFKILEMIRAQDSIISLSKNLIPKLGSITNLDRDLKPRIPLDTFFKVNVVNERLQESRLLVESIKIDPVKLDLNKFYSNDTWKCVIQ